MVDDIEEVAEQNYELGQIVAIEEIAENFLAIAGQYFSSGNDDRAYIFRNEANKLRDTAVGRREKYDIKYKA